MKVTLNLLFTLVSTGLFLSGPVIADVNSSKKVSVSGVSSGAYLAVQLQVAYSKTFMGVGSVAGGPYFCAENMTDITAIKLKCMGGAGIIPDNYEPYRDKAIELSKDGKIDDVSNLKQTRVFIFNSATDQVINPGLGYLSVLFFQYFSDDPSKCDKLHVALHGCQQFPEWTFTGKADSLNAGRKIQFNDLFYNGPFNGVAEANGIVILYPQAYNIGTTQDDINPYGCWEFWPFYEEDKENYYTQEGTEMRMIKAMVDHFSSGD